MTGLPKKGERVTIRWPDGDYDFVMKFEHGEQLKGGWLRVTGALVEPYRDWRTFYVRRAADGLTLAPKLLK